jgi:hypothetical protein
MGGFLKGLLKWYSLATILALGFNLILAPVFALPTAAAGALGQNAMSFVGSAFKDGISAVFWMAVDLVKACGNGITGALGMTTAGAHPIIRGMGNFLATEQPLTFGGGHVVNIAKSAGNLVAASYFNIGEGLQNAWSILSGHALPALQDSFIQVGKDAAIVGSSNVSAVHSQAYTMASLGSGYVNG